MYSLKEAGHKSRIPFIGIGAGETHLKRQEVDVWLARAGDRGEWETMANG